MSNDLPDYLKFPILQMPLGAQAGVLWAFSVLSLVTVVIAVVRSRQVRSVMPIYYVAGAATTCLLEPLLSRLSHAVHAQIGQIAILEAFGVLVPVHAALAYMFYFGISFLILIPLFRERMLTAIHIWWIFGGGIVGAWLFEIPFIWLGLWTYFGDQPMQPFAMQPLWWSTASATMVIVPAVIIAKVEQQLSGWRKLVIIPLVPMGAMGSAAAACWPVWVALNSPAGGITLYIAAISTVVFAVLQIWLIIPSVTRQLLETQKTTVATRRPPVLWRQ